MPHDRYFTENPITLGSYLSLDEEESHHLHVMRKHWGDCVEIINGKNCLAQACIIKTEKKHTLLHITDLQIFSPPPPLILAQALPRITRLDEIVEKGTEIGATEFWLFPGEKSEKKEIKDKDLTRLKRITISATKQCGRLDLPSIKVKTALCSWGDNFSFPAFFGDLSKDASPLNEEWIKKEGTIFFVGPESGFSDKEILILKKLNVKGVKLNPYILRAETASIVSLSLIQQFLLNKNLKS